MSGGSPWTAPPFSKLPRKARPIWPALLSVTGAMSERSPKRAQPGRSSIPIMTANGQSDSTADGKMPSGAQKAGTKARMNRDEMMRRIKSRTTPWDIVIIGGGAVGAGVAVDASSRGFDVLLVEREDFGKGTSSRSTKLVHGGVRYLEQGNISLVMEALKERGLLLRNAPHIVHDLPFVVPNYSWWEAPFYGIGTKVYDLLAGKYNFGKSRVLSLAETLERLPTIQQDGLRGGVLYHDGQFDDTRLLIHLLATAVDHGATVVNYAEAVEFLRGDDGFLSGVVIDDRESNARYTTHAKVVVNATGIFTDETRRLAQSDAEPMVTPSQGIHLVLDRSFLKGDNAIMV